MSWRERTRGFRLECAEGGLSIDCRIASQKTHRPRVRGRVSRLVTPRRNDARRLNQDPHDAQETAGDRPIESRAHVAAHDATASRRTPRKATTGLSWYLSRSTKTSDDTIRRSGLLTNGLHDRSRRPRRRVGDRRPSYRELAQRISRSRPRRMLDGPVVEEQLRYWLHRLSSDDEGPRHLLKAVQGTLMVGFVCVVRDADPGVGTAARQSSCQAVVQGTAVSAASSSAPRGIGRRWSRRAGRCTCESSRTTRTRAASTRPSAASWRSGKSSTSRPASRRPAIRYVWQPLADTEERRIASTPNRQRPTPKPTRP